MKNSVKVDILKFTPLSGVLISGQATLLVKDQVPGIDLFVIEDDRGSRVPQMIPDLDPTTETFSA